MPRADDSEFYVGYLERAPAGLARRTRLAALAIVLSVVAVGAWVAAAQDTWQAGLFEFGQARAFEGTYVDAPYAQLRVARPGDGFSRWLLVQPGKFGRDPDWSVHDGARVRLEGALVHRAEGTLLEVVPGSLTATGEAGAAPAVREDLGPVTLRGEIVDSKCWLGVMNPGNLRTHRACATLCVRGGIPPLLVVRDDQGGTRKLLLVGPEGEAVNAAVLPLIALPVEVSGALSREDDLFVLRADPDSIRRLDD